MNFPSFLEKQFLNWQQKDGKRKSLEEFAVYLGISQSLLSLWLGGRRRPGPENIELLAELFGPEVYDSLGILRPDPDFKILSHHWPNLSEEVRHALREQAEKYTAQNQDDEKSAHSK